MKITLGTELDEALARRMEDQLYERLFDEWRDAMGGRSSEVTEQIKARCRALFVAPSRVFTTTGVIENENLL